MANRPFERMTEEELKINCIIKGDSLKPCFICRKPTKYIDYCSEAHFCSKECLDEFYKMLNNT